MFAKAKLKNKIKKETKFRDSHLAESNWVLRCQNKIIDATKEMAEYYDDKSLYNRTILMTKEDIDFIYHKFLDDCVTERCFRDRMWKNYNGKNPKVVVEFITDERHPDFYSPHVDLIYHRYRSIGALKLPTKTKNVGKSKMVVTIGRAARAIGQAGTGFNESFLKSNIGNLAAIVHEGTHSASNVYNYGRVPITHDYDYLSEVDAMFMEFLFLDYLKNNASQLTKILQKRGVKGVDEELLKGAAQEYDIINAKHLKNHCLSINSVAIEKNSHPKFFHYRYLVGEVYSRLLIEIYKQYPEQVINSISKLNDNMMNFDYDEVAPTLLFGQGGELLKRCGLINDDNTYPLHVMAFDAYERLVTKKLSNLSKSKIKHTELDV